MHSLFYLTVLLIAAHSSVNAEKKQPNIVLILADDVGTGDIPVYWNTSVVDMPNLGSLASKGVTFKDAHATPLCAPSRYMLLSGNYAHRGHRPNGSWGFYENRNQFRNHQKSIAQVLQDAGYHTSMFGKWHLEAQAPPNGLQPEETDFTRLLSDPNVDWNLPLNHGPASIGFETSYITTAGIQAPPYAFFRNDVLAANESSVKFWKRGHYHTQYGMSKVKKVPGDGQIDWDSSAYNMILVNETSKFIDRHLEQNSSQPFFTYVALGSVHIPHSPPYKYIDGTKVRKEYFTRHLDLLFEMDKVVGSVVSMIEDKNLADDTIFIFTSDNGGLLGKSANVGHHISGPMRGKKGDILEGGHRVPLIMRYDNHFSANLMREELVGLNDIYATICELLGLEIPRRSAQDSISFADYVDPSFNDDSSRTRRTHLATWVHSNNRVSEEALRHGNMKLIHNKLTSSTQLYDLENDISESIDLSSNEEYADKIQEMHFDLQALGPCPADVVGKFAIDGMNQTKGCRWFRKNLNRCKRFVEGEVNCYSICGHNVDLCS